jgi:hypothetical protein
LPRQIKTKLTSPGRAPLVAAYDAARASGSGRFTNVDVLYLGAMRQFDGLVAEGIANQGDIQNGKGDFFNDLLAVLLEHCSEKELYTRPDVPGLSFRNHKLDVAYPATGPIELTIETKATGVPKHPGNPKQKHAEGRGGSADLEKRIKEAAFKNIDIKAEVARIEGRGGGPTADLDTFLKSTSPLSYMFLSVRVTDAQDLTRAINFGHVASVWFNRCGLFCYGWNPERTAYEAKPVPAVLELDRVFAHVCTALRGLA